MLLDIVRERTGYPPEVLRLELDLEAELGIDSIKRVEILGKLRDAFPQLGNASDPEAMDRLVSARTLAAIVDRVERAIGSAGAAAAPNPNPPAPTPLEPAAASGTRNGKVHGGARRLLLEAVEAPLGGAEGGLMTGGTVLITEDDRGIAEALAGAIRSRGWQAAIIGGPDSRLDWTSPAAVDKAIRQARRDGPFVGLAHLLPLQSARILEIDAAAWADRMSPEVRGLFLLAKGMGGDLERAAERGGACLIATTAMGGRFASTGRSEVDFFPGHGAIAGLIKTIAREWISVRTRVIDLNVNDGTPRLAERILAEIFHDDAWSEVGYAGARRIRLRTVPAPLSSKAGQDDFSLAPGEPVLITGGARGITSLVAAELARRWRPTLLLIGTTPPPDGSDDAELDVLTDPSELKAALFERLRRGGRAVSPMDLEQAYKALRRAREVRRNLERLRACGSRVEYAHVDVRDFARLGVVVNGWRRLFGEPVGLIHGAGLIRDKLIRDKSLESFDRVLDTKLDGALNVARLLRPESLRFSVFFSSIAGRFGNRGQSDYAAANESLNKLAIWLDRRWPGRVVAPIWGPWSGIGMVSDLEDHLGSRGLGMISPEVGVAALVNELVRGRKGEVEVILAGDLGTLDAPWSGRLGSWRLCDEARSGLRDRPGRHVLPVPRRTGPLRLLGQYPGEPGPDARGPRRAVAARGVLRSRLGANDRVACRRGGYLDTPIPFDPAAYGIMPLAVAGGEPEQFLVLDAARAALADAAMTPGGLDRGRVEVVIGRGNYFNRGNLIRLQHGRMVAQTVGLLAVLHPEWTAEDLELLRHDLKASLPPFEAATIPGQLTNATAGRLADRLDLNGASFVVDAASASSLVALELGSRALIERRADLALVGGVYVEADVDFPLVFSQLGVLSRSGTARPFSVDADGLIPGEGVGVVVLKRLRDAERAGDRIYAVVKGVGLASDGRSRGLTSPSSKGHARAIRRAHHASGIDPATVGLIEGHGLGVPAADRAELRAVATRVPATEGRVARPGRCLFPDRSRDARCRHGRSDQDGPGAPPSAPPANPRCGSP